MLIVLPIALTGCWPWSPPKPCVEGDPWYYQMNCYDDDDGNTGGGLGGDQDDDDDGATVGGSGGDNGDNDDGATAGSLNAADSNDNGTDNGLNTAESNNSGAEEDCDTSNSDNKREGGCDWEPKNYEDSNN